MKKQILTLALIAGLALALTGCSETPVTPAVDSAANSDADKAASLQMSPGHSRHRGAIVVANRASGSISVINSRTAELIETIDLPQDDGDATPEPMYVSQVRHLRRLFVGDRANSRVVVYNSRNFEVIGTVSAGQGVFHMWASSRGDQLWVNNDIDNTMTVIDPSDLTVLATVPVPADLVAMGGKPHDVILDARSRYAYVTVLGVSGPNDYLVQFETDGFSEMNRQPVGKDPHVSLGRNTHLYVPCQNSDQVLVFHPESLELVDELMVPGAHGAAMANNGRYFYTTNLPGGGTGALYTIRTRDNQVVGTPLDTPYPVPHNLALTPDGKMLYVTHSGGTSDKVTAYSLDPGDRQPHLVGEISVGLNPFGIGYVD
jgi:DNA-binding beta-propeller fold protein YncE